MKKAYRVVKRRSRCSCMLDARTNELALKYEKETIVKAPEYTLGIFCFKTFSHAAGFAHFAKDQKIIEVEPIGEGRQWKYIYGDVKNLAKAYREKRRRSCYAPRGTICFPAVKVLT